MSDTAVLKVARPGYNPITANDEDLAFSSDWETPKIFLQTTSSWTNTLDYIPSFMPFRQLNSTDYCHDMLGTGVDTNPMQGIYLDSNGNLEVNTRSGDSGACAILYFNSLSAAPTSTLSIPTQGTLIVAKSGHTPFEHPYYLVLDSRFDTFKIYTTGTLTLEMDAETILAGGSDKTYSTSFNHSLGYPPVYLPAAGEGWDLGYPGVNDTSFTVNDKLGYLWAGYGAGNTQLDVYVDSTYLYMDYTRSANVGMDMDYSDVTVTMYYTVFYNEIGNEFNLLS